MDDSVDIIKYAAVIIRDYKFLIVKEDKDEFWKNVGGKPLEDETPQECLKREIQEELNVQVIGLPVYFFSCPITPTASDPKKTVKIVLYHVNINGEPKPSNEIQNLHWLSREEFINKELPLTLQMNDFIVPRLIEEGLIN